MRRIFCLAAGLVVALSTNLMVQAADDDADAVIEKARKAHIPNEAEAKKLGYRGKNKGTLHINGMDLEFTTETAVQQPNKFRDSMDLTVGNATVNVLTVFNGKEGWIKAGGKDVPVNDDILNELKDVAYMVSLNQGMFVKDKTLKTSLIGEAKVNGKTVIGVKISREGQKEIDYYFDKETGLIAKVERRKFDLSTKQEVTEERILTEYQQMGGRKVPKKIEIKVDGQPHAEVEVIEAESVERIPDSEFAKPN